MTTLTLAGVATALFLSGCSDTKTEIDTSVHFKLARLDNPSSTLQSDTLQLPALLNIWASWCLPCRTEMPSLLALANRNSIPIYGLNYRDSNEKAKRWLEFYGNPYHQIGVDPDGSALEVLAEIGIPQTLLLNANGQVVFRHVGPLTEGILADRLTPLIANLTGVSPP